MGKATQSRLAILFAALGVLMALPALDKMFGWSGSQAPDVLYGYEAGLPQGVILVLVAVEFYRNSRRVAVFAALMIVVTAASWMLAPGTTSGRFAFGLEAAWILVLLAARWSTVRTRFAGPKKATEIF